MPANEEYLRNPKQMHRVFFGSAVLLLLVTMWMMWSDFHDEWRAYQDDAFKLQAIRLKAREASMKSAADHAARLKEIQEKEQKALAEIASPEKQEEIKQREAIVREKAIDEDNFLRKLKLERAIRDVARAEYNLGIRDDLPTLPDLKAKFDKAEETVAGMELEYAEKKNATVEAKQQVAELTGQRDQAKKEEAAEEAGIKLTEAAWKKIDPIDPLQSFKLKLMDFPIVEGFNSRQKVTQDWLPNHKFTLGMTSVQRFDRCRTCHALIDVVDDSIKTSIAGAFPHGDEPNGKKRTMDQWVKDGKYPHPFSSHPNLGLYLSATSPHPLPKFGCTVCHEGQGSGTSFQNASHTPNDPATMEEWAKDHKWFDNHFWERPMFPKRFEESSCIKCHINVVELGVNEKFGATAPKVVRGHELVKKFGCFGCHEISGFDGTRIIGPDLRLEPSTAEEAAEIAKDPNLVAGTMRKVGPSLRHLGSKSDVGFVAHWTEEPKRFRPSTRMPQFFHLDNQSDEKGTKNNAVEIAAMSHYLLRKSEKLDTLAPEEGYTPNAQRGKEFFATKGCVNCHTHQDVPGLSKDFGPELSKVSAKLRAGKVGFDWLYTWIREPERHHPRTKMPHMFLEESTTKDLDPAADIAAFLLKLDGEPADFKPTQDYKAPEVSDADLDSLVSYFLLKVLTKTQMEGVMQTGKYPLPLASIKGDEIELAGGPEELDPAEFRDRKLTYLGRKSITRYGCYGCHDIPNFEQARPIGTALQDWGKKDRSRLAFEHIHEYLHHNGNADLGVAVESIDGPTAARLKREGTTGVRVAEVNRRGKLQYDDVIVALEGQPVTDTNSFSDLLEKTIVGTDVAVKVWRGGVELPEPILVKADGSMQDRVENGISRATRKEFNASEADEKERELSAAFYYQSLTHHGRPGFLWQKLRQPRSYDYKMIDTKPYDDRLRMPEFPFSEDDIDAIATFVVGLVAEPPVTEFLYNPSGAAGAKIKGEKLIEQFNCAGCHMLELPKIRYGADVDQITASDPAVEYPAAIALLRKLRPFQNGLTGEKIPVKTADGSKTLPIVQFHGMVAAYPDPEDPPEDREYVVELWDALTVAGKELFPTSKLIFPAANLDHIEAPRGGAYAEWLVKKLVKDGTAKEPSLAWQMSPPPLWKQGTKVQTPWLFNFLRNPGRLRHTTVLRMPKFNMSDEDAQALANYFAAIDGTEFPYQLIAEREPAYLNAKNEEFHSAFPGKKQDYLQESWQMLNAPLCIKCHSVGGRQVTISDPKTDIRGPNLDLATERLKPDWMMLWLFRPQWITPYTSMPAPLPPQQAGAQVRYPEILGGDGLRQTVSLRDALVNYYKLMEREGKVPAEPKPAVAAGGND